MGPVQLRTSGRRRLPPLAAVGWTDGDETLTCYIADLALA